MSFYYYIYSALKALPDAAACAIPLALIAALSVWHAIKKRHKKYAVLCAAVHALAAVLYSPRMNLNEVLFCLAAGIFINIAAAFLCKIRRREKRKAPSFDDIARECVNEGAAEKPGGKSAPEKILCYPEGSSYSGGEYNLNDEGISLNHAIGLATALKRARLAVGDRLEADNIYRILTEFRSKNNLTGEEMSALNGYLSTLLKLTAKYSL